MTIKEMVENQKEVIRFLKNSYESNHLSHAYLFEGEEGCGKYEAALYMSMMLLCESDNKPCMRCHNCIRIEKNNHLNLLCIEPENGMIKKDQVEELIHELTMTSLEKGAQIGIIKEAEKMNVSASNALLKLLEEPAPNHYIFLLTDNMNKMLDTIISRSQVIRFKATPRKYLINSLVDNGVDLDMAYVLSYVTSDLEHAKELIEEGKIYSCLNLALEIEKAMILQKDPYPIFFLQSAFLKDETNKKYHRLFLDILILINKEIINIYNNTSNGYFESLMKQYKNTEKDINKIIKKIETISNYQERLGYFVNMNLFYTSLMIEINK